MKRRKQGRGVNATGRSDRPEQYANFGYPLLQSPAFRSLSGNAVKVFLEVRSRYNGGNNGNLVLSLDQGARLLGMGKATVRRAFAELQEKGFLICTKVGQWYGRQASTWAITLLAIDGNMPTNDWKRWQPPKKQPTPCAAGPKKTESGSQTAPWHDTTGSEMDRSEALGSAAAPVSAVLSDSMGSNTDR